VSSKKSTSKKIYSIIEAIQLEKNNRHEIVIITTFLSTIMAAENRTPTKNPKTQAIRKMLDHEGLRITLLWVTSHVEIPGNEKVNQAVKKTLDQDISITEWYPPDDLKKWLTEEDFKKREQRLKNRNHEMKVLKSDVDRKEDTKVMQRKKQVTIFRLEPGIRRPPKAPRWKWSAIHCALSVTPIYPSTTYCGNAKKLRTREWAWTWERNNGSTRKKVIDYAEEIELYIGI
jgi:hypothetical protein